MKRSTLVILAFVSVVLCGWCVIWAAHSNAADEFVVEGTVRAPDGGLLSNVTVTVIKETGTIEQIEPRHTLTTESDGRYEFRIKGKDLTFTLHYRGPSRTMDQVRGLAAANQTIHKRWTSNSGYARIGTRAALMSVAYLAKSGDFQAKEPCLDILKSVEDEDEPWGFDSSIGELKRNLEQELKDNPKGGARVIAPG